MNGNERRLSVAARESVNDERFCEPALALLGGWAGWTRGSPSLVLAALKQTFAHRLLRELRAPRRSLTFPQPPCDI
jgi:hypothetical protein